MPKRTRKVRGWVRLDGDGDILETRNKHDWDNTFPIKMWKKVWREVGDEIVPCTITYLLPNKKPKKK